MPHLLNRFFFKHVVTFRLSRLNAPIHDLQLDARPLLHLLPHGDLAEGVGRCDPTHTVNASLLVGANGSRVITERGKESVLKHEVRHHFTWLELTEHLEVVRLFAAFFKLHQYESECAQLLELTETVIDPLVSNQVLLY